MAFQTTSSAKVVTMPLLNNTGYYANNYYATINYIVREGEEIYGALRDTISGKIDPRMSIIVWHPSREEKVRLHFDHLHEGQLYRV